MRPTSSTWRSSRRGLLPLLLLVHASLTVSSVASAELCLPPVFEGGRRIFFDVIRVGSVDLVLRQHQACWRSPASEREQRVFVYGNSTIFGFPHAAQDTAVGILNRRLDARGTDAHLFNFGYVLSYNLKDALIVRESLRYEPDVIVYSTMLDDWIHVAPLDYPPLLRFFGANSPEVERFAGESPPGIGEGFAHWHEAQVDRGVRRIAAWTRLQDVGNLIRLAAGNWSRELRQLLFPDMPMELPEILPTPKYSCDDTLREFEVQHTGWRGWDALAYLEQVREQTGAEILVVSWPARRDARGPCFNRRYPTAALREYRPWIARNARARGFHFVDLQDDFPQDEFLDSVHTTAAGQAIVARLLEPHLLEVLAAARKR